MTTGAWQSICLEPVNGRVRRFIGRPTGDEIGLWWRRDTPYWNDRERGLTIRIEPGVGGRFLEPHRHR